MKIGIGQDTRVTGLGRSLTDLRIGQQIQIIGIYAKDGPAYLTTDYWGYYKNEKDIHRGTIQIMSDDIRKLTAHKIWVEKENARRAEYGLLKKMGLAK